MAVITNTPASVAYQKGSRRRRLSGEAMPKGCYYYINQNDGGRIYMAKSSGTAAEADVKGVTLNEANAAGEWIDCDEGAGEIDTGAVLTVGSDLYLSTTYGKACLRSDLAQNNRIVFIGCPKTTSRLKFNFCNAEALVP